MLAISPRVCKILHMETTAYPAITARAATDTAACFAWEKLSADRSFDPVAALTQQMRGGDRASTRNLQSVETECRLADYWRFLLSRVDKRLKANPDAANSEIVGWLKDILLDLAAGGVSGFGDEQNFEALHRIITEVRDWIIVSLEIAS